MLDVCLEMQARYFNLSLFRITIKERFYMGIFSRCSLMAILLFSCKARDFNNSATKDVVVKGKSYDADLYFYRLYGDNLTRTQCDKLKPPTPETCTEGPVTRTWDSVQKQLTQLISNNAGDANGYSNKITHLTQQAERYRGEIDKSTSAFKESRAQGRDDESKFLAKQIEQYNNELSETEAELKYVTEIYSKIMDVKASAPKSVEEFKSQLENTNVIFNYADVKNNSAAAAQLEAAFGQAGWDMPPLSDNHIIGDLSISYFPNKVMFKLKKSLGDDLFGHSRALYKNKFIKYSKLVPATVVISHVNGTFVAGREYKCDLRPDLIYCSNPEAPYGYYGIHFDRVGPSPSEYSINTPLDAIAKVTVSELKETLGDYLQSMTVYR